MNTSLKAVKRIFTFGQLILITFIAVSAINAQTSGVDLSFNAIPDKDLPSPPNFVVQADNKIIVFGNFQVAEGAIRDRIARFNTDGSLDTSFNCSSCNSSIAGVVVQPDGKILVSGSIGISSNTYPLSVPIIYRLNSDGSRDSSFTSPFTTDLSQNVTGQSAIVNSVQPDGKILVTLFTAFTGGYISYDLYKLNINGTFDSSFTTFNVGGGRLSARIPSKIMSLPDGKILVAGNAHSNPAFLGRYNSDGSVDSTFERPTISSSTSYSSISDFDVQSDGSLIVVGGFIAINGVNRAGIAKLQVAGNVDVSFPNLTIAGINRVKILSNGKILIATSNRIYRLNADGSTDNSFNSPTNITQIDNFKLDTAERIIIYGTFTD
ncbi:MAG TPA: hypothetical protein VK308_14955, partial [Pyrinomonadaceae bacterium]|nr:hypothetical protein [Pyrinomonadaceae bacterium]